MPLTGSHMPMHAGPGRFWILFLPALLGGCAQYEGPSEVTYWPTEGWRQSTPEAQGLDSEALARAVDYIRVEGLAVDSLLIVRHGHVVLDAYLYPYSDAILHDVASVTKSITATLIGIAIDQGLIASLDVPMLAFFPEFSGDTVDERKAQITMRDLISMTSGFGCGYQRSEPELQAMIASRHWVESVLDLPMADDPGRAFSYCSGNTHLLSAILSRAAATSTLSFARAKLFGPLGINAVEWPTDLQGVQRGWADLRMHPRDMAKIGFLMLHDGRWEGRQIVSQAWVREATREQVPVADGEAGYGFGWWVLKGEYEGVFEARGRGGQVITVWPGQDLVAVFTGGDYDRAALIPFLRTALKSWGPLPDNPKGLEHLRESLRRASVAPSPSPVPPLPSGMKTLSGVRYLLDDNRMGLQSLMLKFDGDDAATLSLDARGERFTFAVGLDGVPRVSETSPSGLAVGIKGRWISNDEFLMQYDEIAGANNFSIYLRFADEAIAVQIHDPTGMYDAVITGSRSQK